MAEVIRTPIHVVNHAPKRVFGELLHLIGYLIYTFPSTFSARRTFSGLSGSFVTCAPVVLWIALAIQAIGETEAISPAPQ